jgi:hypothetical protein
MTYKPPSRSTNGGKRLRDGYRGSAKLEEGAACTGTGILDSRYVRRPPPSLAIASWNQLHQSTVSGSYHQEEEMLSGRWENIEALWKVMRLAF